MARKTLRRIALAGIVLTAVCNCVGSRETNQQPLPTGEFGRQLDAVASRASSDGEGIPCASRAFGVSPPRARNLAEVTEIYAWSICSGHILGKVVSGSYVQVAVRMSRPPVATEPTDGVGPGSADFDSLFPPDVRTWAGAEPAIAWIERGSN